MQLLLILIFATATYFKDDIKGIDSYSIFQEQPSISYELVTKDKNNNELSELNYEPVVSSFLGLSVTYKGYGASFTYQNDDENKEGIEESDLFDFQLRGIKNRYLWEVYYQNYHGLYISDSINVLSSDQPKASSYSYGFDIKYFTKKDFDLSHSFSNFAAKKETNWSWVHGLSINKASLYSNKTLIPSAYESNFDELKGLRELQSTSIGYNFGIAGMYTYKSFFIGGVLSLGMQFQEQETHGLNEDPRHLTDSAASTKFGFGYSGKDKNIGMDLSVSNYTIPVQNAEFTNVRTIVHIYYKYFF